MMAFLRGRSVGPWEDGRTEDGRLSTVKCVYYKQQDVLYSYVESYLYVQ